MSSEDRGTPPSKRTTVALVNDYELVLRGIAEMLRPFRDRIDVVESDVDHNPEVRVDIALFDPYGNTRLGLDRVASLTQDSNVGKVAIYTWNLRADQRDSAIASASGSTSCTRHVRPSS